jgi:hypothetical protein
VRALAQREIGKFTARWEAEHRAVATARERAEASERATREALEALSRVERERDEAREEIVGALRAFLCAHDRCATYAKFTIEFATAEDEALDENAMRALAKVRAILARHRESGGKEKS